jgi:hypothetical protein
MENEMKVRSLSTFSLFVFVTLITTAGAQQNERAPGAMPGGTESIGGKLLDDLGTVETQSAPAPARPTNEVERRMTRPEPAFRIDQPTRFDDLGEDLGAPSGPLPLVRARQNMQQAGAILAQAGDVNDAQAAQQRVIAQLDELINGLCKQCQGGGSKPGQKPSQANKPAQPKPGAAKPGFSAIAPRDSVDEPKQPGERQLNPADREALVKQLWGHLPEREREQMLQSLSGEFLPKYELELEKYYRRLAEERDESGGK